MDDQEKLFAAVELRLFPVTHGFQETIVWSGKFRTLYVNDLFIGTDQIGSPSSLVDYPLYLTKRMLFIPDWKANLAMQSYCRAMYYKDLPAARAQMREVVELPIARLVLTHGPVEECDPANTTHISRRLKGSLEWLLVD